MTNKTIQLKRSSELNVNGDGPKLPTKDKLEYGEIAINFAVGHETISLKNSNNEIVPIKINGDGKVLTQNDVVDIEPEILTDDYKKKPVSAFRSFNGLNALANRIYGANGLNSKVGSNSNAIDSNKTNIATNTNAINGLTTGLDKIKEDQRNIDTRLTALESQLNGVETQTTNIISQEDNIITNAQ